MATMDTDPSAGAVRTLTPLYAPRAATTAAPIPADPIIGREQELDALLAMLGSPRIRLLTLTGPGGVGKTRLAVEVARRFDGVVRYMSLVSITDPDLVPLIVGQHLGLRDLGPRPAADLLARLLREPASLFIVDNVEQVLPAMPLLTELLARCEGLTILATSRTRLHLTGEHELPVSPLRLPNRIPAPRPADVTALLEVPSVALFVDRTRALDPRFVLTPETGPAVAELCRRLDGLPLAIELAATWCKTLRIDRLPELLSSRLDVLRGGPQDRPDHQRTMRGTIAWSYGLLTPEAQRLFRRMGACAGGSTLDVANLLADDIGRSETEALDALATLVDHSLVMRIEDDTGSTRFTMLETIRVFAEEQLDASDEANPVRHRLAAYFLDLAERASREFNGPEQARWLDWLAVERPNLRATLSWLRDQGDTCAALRLAAAIGLFHWCRGHHGEGRAMLEATLALPDAGTRGPAWTAAMTALGLQVSMQGDIRAGARIHERAIAAWRTFDQPAELAQALWFHGLGLMGADPSRAGAAFEESLAIARELDIPWLTAYALWGVGHVHRVERDLPTATRTFEEARDLIGDTGSQTANAAALWTFGQLALDRGDIDEAIHLHGQALEAFAAIGKPWGGTDCVEALGVLAGLRGEPERAVRLLAAADAWRQVVGMARPPLVQQAFDEAVATLRASQDDATFDAAWNSGSGLHPDDAVAAALAVVADHQAGRTSHRPPVTERLGLTRRETEVLDLLATGLSDREIAAALSISPRTVSGHVTNVLGKLGVSSRSAATAMALRDGLVEPSRQATA